MDTKTMKDIKIQGVPVIPFMIMFVIIMVSVYTECLGDDILSTVAFLLALGGILFEIGNKIPVFNKWVGGGSMLAMMVPSWMVYKELIPPKYVEATVNFYDGISFQTLFICFLMAGSLLVIEKNTLVKSIVKYIPTILAGIVTACIFGIIAGAVMGYDVADIVCNYVLPIMGGGNGAGAVPMSQVYAEVTGGDKDAFYAKAIAILTFANILCIVVAALLNGLGKQFPKLTGDSTQLMRDSSSNAVKDKNVELPKASLRECANGFLWVGAVFAAACVIKNFAPKVAGASIHQYAWFVLLLAILNVADVIPLYVRSGIKTVTDLFTKNWSGVVFAGIGIALTDFSEFISVINMDTLVISLAVVIGAVVGTAAFGFLLGLYPVDAAVTAGLCMANRGGGGDVVVLGAAERMELMSYAAISSRIGGAIVLIIASIIFGILY
ncbi:MAG: 2-hydroxycarboxylate transporter family protein [Hungatella sp.]|nr:2-hydroxycarboxylate transporter family protein [Hungatella sp.]